MNDVSLTPLLASYAQAPTPDLMAQLVEGYLPLSHAIARRFMGHGVELEDLQQVAAMALMKAIERFDPDRGLKFSTFAAPTITGEVRNFIRDKGAAMRMSRDVRSQLYRMQQVQDKLTQRLLREPTLREVADEMNVYSQIAFLDDGEKDACLGFSVLGRVKDATNFVREYEFFVAIGNGATREVITQEKPYLNLFSGFLSKTISKILKKAFRIIIFIHIVT